MSRVSAIYWSLISLPVSFWLLKTYFVFLLGVKPGYDSNAVHVPLYILYE